MLKIINLILLKILSFQIIINIQIMILIKLLNYQKINCKIITTEKDYLRLEKDKFNEIKFIKSELKY